MKQGVSQYQQSVIGLHSKNVEMRPMDFEKRSNGAGSKLEEVGVEALLVTSPVNIRYLTGFTGSAGILLISNTGSGYSGMLATDGRYEMQARDQIRQSGVQIEVFIGSPPDQLGAVAAASSGMRRIGVESENITLDFYSGMLDSGIFASSELVPLKGTIESLRVVKDFGEVDRIARAAEIADEAFASIVSRLAGWVSTSGGITEADVAAELDHAMRMRGSSEPAFETIIACGLNGARPHHRASDSRLMPGKAIVFDFGATIDGYRSDMTRTLCVGEPDSPVIRDMFAVVAESQLAGVRAARLGAGLRDIDIACRSVVGSAGWAKNFIHGTGHGVGLDIHEKPWIGAASVGILAEGMVLTVEPGVYLEEYGGVRIEDTVVITSEGGQVLTRSPKEPFIS